MDKYFGMLNHESNLKLGDSGSTISLKATKKGKYLMSSIFRVKIEVRITSRIRSLKAAMSEAMSAVVVVWVKAGVKTGKTLDGTQAKREELISWQTLKILLDLRRQFTAYKGNVLNYCMTVKRIKFKLIRIKAWMLGSCLIERLNSLQACRTSRSCGRVHQVEVVDLVGVYDRKSGSPKTISLAITNRKTVFKGNSGK